MENEQMQQGTGSLDDGKFKWTVRKMETVRLAHIYEEAGYKRYAERVAACSTALQFDDLADGSQRLKFGNFCCIRLCPMCMARRARRSSYKLCQIMDYVEKEHGCTYIFLTLTVRNCEAWELGETISLLTSGWVKLIRHRSFERAVGGWFRALEITRNPKNGTYHPHIHAILAVPSDYAKKKAGLYLTQKKWREHWAVATGLDYDPYVYVCKTHEKHFKNEKRPKMKTDVPSKAASKEAAKYVTKSKEYISPKLDLETAADIVSTYTEALRKRRLVAFGGWMKDAAKRFDADDLDVSSDLVHVDDDRIREDLAIAISTYHWSFGAGDYILYDRELNPELVCLETGELVVASGLEKQGVSGGKTQA